MSSNSLVRSVSSRKFNSLVNKNSPTELILVDFYAPWCGPCKMLAPKLEKLAQKYPNVTFLKVDVEKSPDLASTYQVSSLPTFILLEKGAPLESKFAPIIGASLSKVEAILQEALKNCSGKASVAPNF